MSERRKAVRSASGMVLKPAGFGPDHPFVPFEPIAVDRLPEGPPWISQIKWDGVRMICYYDGLSTRLINRRGNERTMQYPELSDAGGFLRKPAVLDGEIIALAEGKPSFHEVMRRDSLRREESVRFAVGRIPVLYMVFDLLRLGDRWLFDEPLDNRRRLLEEALLPHPHVRSVPSYANAAELYGSAVRNGLEGIVCKDGGGLYVPGGKDGRWRKRKIISDLNAVAGGVTFRDGIVNALLLGQYDRSGRLHYIGHAGAGKLKVQDWRELTELSSGLAIPSMPFCALPERAKGVLWLKPQLVFKVEYLERNPSGTLRHPVLQGRTGIPPHECLLD